MARLDKTIQKSNTIRTKNGTLDSSSKIQVFFYKSSLGKEIKLVQLGWPIGMPLVRNLRGGLWENGFAVVNYAIEVATERLKCRRKISALISISF